MAGLLPIMWSHGTGAEVMQRIAVPMIGGMVSSTVLMLVVIPAIYAAIKGQGAQLVCAGGEAGRGASGGVRAAAHPTHLFLPSRRREAKADSN